MCPKNPPHSSTLGCWEVTPGEWVTKISMVKKEECTYSSPRNRGVRQAQASAKWPPQAQMPRRRILLHIPFQPSSSVEEHRSLEMSESRFALTVDSATSSSIVCS